MNVLTLDRISLDSSTADMYYTVEELGPTRHLTPEGFLVCVGTPIARTGEMEYGPGETPLPVGQDGKVRVVRSPKEVFSTVSMASIAGKPITDDHPPVDVSPENWTFYTKGVVVNPRRGSNEFTNFLIADLIIFDVDLIEDINSGKREVSCGYNPEYIGMIDAQGRDVPGRGEQINIIYNHLALVECGRCGPRCSIGDRKTVDSLGAGRNVATVARAVPLVATKSVNSMRKETPMSWKDKLKSLVGASQHSTLDAILLEAQAEGAGVAPIIVHNHMPGRGARDAEGAEMEREKKEPDEVVIHNHMPGEDAERSTMPERPDAGARASDDESPPWFKKFEKDCADKFKSMDEAISGLKKFADEEEEEGIHSDADPNMNFGGEEPEKDPVGAEGDARRGRDKGKDEENKKILGELEFEAPPGTGDAIRKAKDSALLADAFQDACSKAEILAPGIRLPAFDRAAVPIKTFKTINALRKTALDLAYTVPAARGAIDAAMGGRSLDSKTMAPGNIRVLFNSVSAALAETNHRRSTDGTFAPVNGAGIPAGPPRTIADINRRNAEKFGRKTA